MKHLLLSLGLLLVCVTASLAQDKTEYVSRDNPAHADIDLLVKSGVIDGFGERPRTSVPTRYELAVATAVGLRNLGLTRSSGQPIASSASESSLLNKPEIVAALKRLAKEFQFDLKRLGVPIEQIRVNGLFLIEPPNTQPKLPVAPPFPDVPKNHWAYEAVETLRLSGIMIGIPLAGAAHFNSSLER